MEYLITVLILSAVLFLGSTLVKSEYWFHRLFLFSFIGYFLALIISLKIESYGFSSILVVVFLLLGFKLFQASKSGK